MRKRNHCPAGQHGPDYDVESAALRRFRNLAKNSLADLTREQRADYGRAVGAAVRAKQAAQLRRALEPERRAPCASGTWHSDGADIHKAMREQHTRRTQSWPSAIRKARTESEWREMYQDAMAEKRERQP